MWKPSRFMGPHGSISGPASEFVNGIVIAELRGINSACRSLGGQQLWRRKSAAFLFPFLEFPGVDPPLMLRGLGSQTQIED